MQNNKKSKSARLKRLHMILDSESNKKLHPVDEKYLTSLSRRLKGQSKESIVYAKPIAKDKEEKGTYSLEPKVIIHLRVEKDVIPEKKTEEFPEIKIEKEEPQYEEEDIFEVEKIEVTQPEFIRVKPKVIEKLEPVEEFEDKKTLAEKELTEWEPVEVEKKELEKFPEKITVHEEEKVEEVEQLSCSKCGTEIHEGAKFCAECGNDLYPEEESTITHEPIPTFIPVEKVEEEEEQIEVEPAPPIEELPTDEPVIEREVKLDAFRDIESINDETAIILYDNGITTIDEINTATLKDLIKIKGIKRKTAKKIKKEIEEKSEWEPIEAIGEKIEEKDSSLEIEQIEVGETAEGEITEKQVQEEEEIIGKEIKIKAFKDMESINDDVAIILYDSGFTSVDLLKETRLKDLTKIKGIKRKTAKKIKKEIEEKSEWEPVEIEKDEPSKIDEKIIEHEPEKNSDEVFQEEKIEEKTYMKIEEEEVFKDINSIDKKIAKLLQENGIDSIYKLDNTHIKKLTKIRGIKRKIAKKIKQEVNELIEKTETSEKETFERGENPFIYDDEEEEDQWESYDEDKISATKKKEIKGFKHKDYTLYEKEIVVKPGKKRTIRFFSKAEPDEGKPIELPKDYKVKENKKTGVPYLKKKK